MPGAGGRGRAPKPYYMVKRLRLVCLASPPARLAPCALKDAPSLGLFEVEGNGDGAATAVGDG